MTIAVGMLCKEGVLLCADTEESDWQTKSHASKVRTYDFPQGKVSFAYAGNTRFAQSAMRKCWKKLLTPQSSKGKQIQDPESVIEAILDQEYRRNVLDHPSQATDSSLHYWLLIALWTVGNPAKLYVTSRTALVEIEEYECVGIGEPLAKHLIKPGFSNRMPYSEALVISAYALAIVKEQNTECGGMSIFSLLQHDGGMAFVTSVHTGVCENIENYALGYDFLCRKLLLHILDPAKDALYFERNLEDTFLANVRRIHREVQGARQKREMEFANLNPHLDHDQVKQLNLRLSIGLPPLPPPSPESPGGSGES